MIERIGACIVMPKDSPGLGACLAPLLGSGRDRKRDWSRAGYGNADMVDRLHRSALRLEVLNKLGGQLGGCVHARIIDAAADEPPSVHVVDVALGVFDTHRPDYTDNHARGRLLLLFAAGEVSPGDQQVPGATEPVELLRVEVGGEHVADVEQVDFVSVVACDLNRQNLYHFTSPPPISGEAPGTDKLRSVVVSVMAGFAAVDSRVPVDAAGKRVVGPGAVAED